MIQVHGRANSSNVQKVLWTLHELGLAFQRQDRGGAFGGLDDPAYLALNPNGKVPTVVDGALALWESHAILRHYARAHPESGLLPVEPAALTRVDMLLDWTQTTLWPGLRLAYIGTEREGLARDAPEVVAALDQTARNLEVLSKVMGDGAHLAGDGFTIADIAVAICVARYRFLGRDLAPWPTVAAWFERCGAREGYRRHVTVGG